MVKRKAEISLDKWLVQSARLGGPTMNKAAEILVDQPHAQGPALVEADSETELHQSAAAEPTVSPTTGENEHAEVRPTNSFGGSSSKQVLNAGDRLGGSISATLPVRGVADTKVVGRD